jgi:hypothetical protein
VEKDLNLPTEYFEKEENNLLEEDVSNNKDLLSVENFTPTSIQEDSEENTRQETSLPVLNIPEKQLANSTEVADALMPTTNNSQNNNSVIQAKTSVNAELPQKNNSNIQTRTSLNAELPQNNNSNIQTRPAFNAEQIIEEISSIDNKINNLEKQIENLNSEEKENFNNIVQQDNNTFNEYNSEEGDNVIEVFSNKNTLQKQYLKRDINLLIRQKEKLKIEQQKLINNTPFVDDNQFVSNFSDQTTQAGNEALQKSLEVEEFLNKEGDEPVVVQDKNIGTAVISESQGNLENAVEEHGGLDNALKDSINNQNNYTQFVPNFSTEPMPDNNATVANNTQKILEVVTGLSSILKDLVGSMKSGSNSNSSTTSSNKENTSQTSNSQPTAPATQSTPAQGSREFKPTSNFKGDLPSADDFPAGFDLTQLRGSNLLTRI